MTTEERLDRLEDAVQMLVALNDNVVELLQAQSEMLQAHGEILRAQHEQIAEVRRDASFTQKIWVAFAQHFGLPPEMWQDDLP